MLELENVVFRYSRRAEPVLRGVSLTLNDGEIGILLGKNGAGKTTLFQCILGLAAPESGSIRFDGGDLLKMPRRERAKLVAYVPQHIHFGALSVFDSILLGRVSRFGMQPGREDIEAAEHILAEMHLEPLADRSAEELSGGEKQKIAIARALVQEPRLLIFDEPTVGLDPKQIIEIRNLIRGLGKAHTVILSTHILQEVQAVCDRIIIINKGKIVANEKTENISSAVDRARRFNAKICGPQKDVLAMLRAFPGITYAEALAERDGDAYTYMIESDYGVDIRKKLFFDLANRGWALIGLEALGMSLEDIFISVVDHSEDLRQRGGAQRVSRKQKAMEKNTAEKEIGASLVEDAKKQRAEAALHDTEDDD